MSGETVRTVSHENIKAGGRGYRRLEEGSNI